MHSCILQFNAKLLHHCIKYIIYVSSLYVGMRGIFQDGG